MKNTEEAYELFILSLNCSCQEKGPCHSFSIASLKDNCHGNFPSLSTLPSLRSVWECRQTAITVSLSITGNPCLAYFTNVNHPNTAMFGSLKYNSNQEGLK